MNDRPEAMIMDDVGSILTSSVLDRSGAVSRPFKVNYDEECSFCKKNRQIVLVNEEYEHPEPTFIKRMPASVAALSYDQDHFGRSVVILRDHETDLNYVLKNKLLIFMAFLEDVSAVVDAIQAVCKADRINYAIYMNLHDHLHVHLIPRYRSEGENFNKPPFFSGRSEMDADFDYRSLALKIRKNLAVEPSTLSSYVEKIINDGLPS
ncbi:diadenosine tetraphosphatase [Methanocella sp. CWC-04]|uniref:Diadenosine tetraphosphatase n=2 Tax=Methanooceanicella nereidis TaxID=2052831 RepID=A0AAP2RD15_9EURY|nr:diadenosine tetraphosphatase [Methanocella sp. CWC-04]